MFFVLALVLLLFLPDPWNVVVGLASLGLFVGEVFYWRRRMHAYKVQTGVENLVGATGTVTKPLAPVGQVRVLGELWEARSTGTLPAGSAIRVVAVNGLRLEVEPESEGAATQSTQ